MLNAKQRQYLKGLAHALEPVVRIGKAGLTPAVMEETRKTLQSHELIKVRIDGADDSAERRVIAEALASDTGADVAATIGKMAILYRPREEKPRIKLPV